MLVLYLCSPIIICSLKIIVFTHLFYHMASFLYSLVSIQWLSVLIELFIYVVEHRINSAIF